MKALGAVIRELRKERGLTITDVHFGMRMQHKSIAKIERGEGYPRFDTLLKVCQVLDVKPSELLEMAERKL